MDERRVIAERAERLKPGCHVRVRLLQAIDKLRPECRPHAIVMVNDLGRTQFLLAIPLRVDRVAHLIIVTVDQLAETQPKFGGCQAQAELFGGKTPVTAEPS